MSDIDKKCRMLAEHMLSLEPKVDKLQESIEAMKTLIGPGNHRAPELEPYAPIKETWPLKPYPYNADRLVK